MVAKNDQACITNVRASALSDPIPKSFNAVTEKNSYVPMDPGAAGIISPRPRTAETTTAAGSEKGSVMLSLVSKSVLLHHNQTSIVNPITLTICCKEFKILNPSENAQKSNHLLSQ